MIEPSPNAETVSVGVYYCIVHHSIANEDAVAQACDLWDASKDLEGTDCQYLQLGYHLPPKRQVRAMTPTADHAVGRQVIGLLTRILAYWPWVWHSK